MNLANNKIIIFSIFVALVNLFVLGCFFANQTLSYHQDSCNIAMDCCNIGSHGSSDHAGYNLQYNVVEKNSWQINLPILAFFLSLIVLKDSKFFSYFLARDKAGGFRLFDKFLILFKKGILNPKTY